MRQKLFFFTPLESPAACPVRSSASIGACSGDEDIIPFRANTEFNAPCEPPRWKVKDFLTGFTSDDFDVRIINDAPFTPLEIMPRSVSSPAIAGLEFLTGFTIFEKSLQGRLTSCGQ